MTRTLFLFRPEPGWSASAKQARIMGLRVGGEPLFAMQPCEWRAPDPAGFDAVLAGSANAFRLGGTQLDGLRDLPVLAVGDATADAAREVGFSVERVGSGGLQALVDGQPPDKTLLRLAGEKRVALTLADGIRVKERVVYRAVPSEIARDTAAALMQGGVAALHSGEAARQFAYEVERLGLNRGRISLVLIGPRLAPVCGEGWKSVHIADRPGDVALLALARDVCNQA